MKGTLVSVVVLLAMTTPQAYGAGNLLQTIEVESVDPPGPHRPPYQPGQGIRYSGRAVDADGYVVVQIGENVKLPNPASSYAVTHIAIEEQRDNPCRISLWGRMVDERFRTPERKLAQFALDTCTIDQELERALANNNIKDKELTGFDGPKKFIRGLPVCMGGARDPLGVPTKIKGLRLRPAVVDQTDSGSLFTVISEDDPQTSTQRHCPEPETKGKGNSEYPEGWASWNMCPDDQLVTGVRVYFNPENNSNSDKTFRALGVDCKGLRVQGALDPVKDHVGY